MTTDAITQKEQGVTDRPRLTNDSQRELAPSILREDQPTIPRFLGMIGAMAVIFGGMALTMHLIGRPVIVGRGLAIFCLTLGLSGLLFHAAFDPDVQFRRMYFLFGLVTMGLGLVLAFVPYPTAVGDQLRWSVPCLVLALLFLLAFLRNEDQPFLRLTTQKIIGTAGASLALVGLVGGNINREFFLPLGLVFSLLGLLYLTAFVASRRISDDLAYYVAIGLAGAGGLVSLVVLGRTLLASGGSTYFVGVGVILLFVGLLYVAVGLGTALDWPILVMTRRELGSFFYSPIAYLALLGFSVCWWGCYWTFLGQLLDSSSPMGSTILEPVVRNYYFALVPVILLLFVVPVLTMRLLSEEQRTGTMEVLLTAPVDEPAIVFSKFLASLITYLVMWLPSALFLLAIPLSGGNPFDYRPLVSFLVVVVITGAAFVSMGLFFSSLSKNQIASAVLTFAGMIALMVVYFASHLTRDNAWEVVLTHVSFLDLWFNTLEGKIVPRFLLFWLSMTVLFLFMTVKVLESRKWR